MKQPTFTAHQSALNKALSICSRALNDNNILPINSMFLFDIQANKLTVSAFDMRIIISTECEISGSLNMKLCVPGKKVLDYASKSANEVLTFIIETHIIPEVRETIIHPQTDEPYESVTPERISFSLTIKTTSGKCTIPCELGEDFPKLPNNPDKTFSLPSEDFLEMLYKTMFAISDDQLRPSATGVNFRIEPGKITATALDFNQVSTYTLSAELNFDADFIMPKKALQQIQSLSPIGTLEMSVSKSALSVSWGFVKTTSLLIDEKFPDYLSVTPVNNHIDFVTSRSVLINSLKRLLPFTDITNMVKLIVSANSLLITAENIDYSEKATETIPGALANGEPIVIGCNGEFLIGILNSLTDDKVWFSFDTPRGAIIITESEKHINPSKENLALLMPVFIS